MKIELGRFMGPVLEITIWPASFFFIIKIQSKVKYPEINTDGLIEDLAIADPNYKNEITAIEKKYNCSIDCSIEKHNALQYTYFYEVDFGKEEMFFVEIESGISNGTQLNNAEWGQNTMSRTKTVEVLKDIVLDCDYYKSDPFLKKKAQAVLSANKSKLFEFHRQNNYDNYVTGGNSKLKLDSFLSQLQLKYIYEEQEVDCNFV